MMKRRARLGSIGLLASLACVAAPAPEEPATPKAEIGPRFCAREAVPRIVETRPAVSTSSIAAGPAGDDDALPSPLRPFRNRVTVAGVHPSAWAAARSLADLLGPAAAFQAASIIVGVNLVGGTAAIGGAATFTLVPNGSMTFNIDGVPGNAITVIGTSGQSLACVASP